MNKKKFKINLKDSNATLFFLQFIFYKIRKPLITKKIILIY